MHPFETGAGEQACPVCPGEQDVQSLVPLIARVWDGAAAYAQIARELGGRDAALLRRLSEQAQSQAACLKGIYTLIAGRRANVRFTPAAGEPVQVALRRCYGREMKLLASFEAWTNRQDYGHVFTCLARQSREHCGVILEVLGRNAGTP